MRQQILYEYDTFSQEIRMASPEGSGPFRWLGGGYFFDEEKDTEFIFDYRQGYPAWGIPPFKSYLNNVLDTKGYAFFGQATYTLFEKLDLTAGLRYDNEEQDFTFDGYYDQDLSPWGMLPRKVKADENFAEWLPKFSIDYRFSPDFMIYASAETIDNHHFGGNLGNGNGRRTHRPGYCLEDGCCGYEPGREANSDHGHQPQRAKAGEKDGELQQEVRPG
jgi:hypothetical protein